MVKETTPKESIENFWNGIWGERKACNMSASLIGNMEKGNENVKEQEWENITVLELKAALTKFQKWKSPGIDKVPNCLVKCPFIVPYYFYKVIEQSNVKPGKTPKWMCEGTTYLLAKSNDTKDPKNYRSVTCLSTNYKLLTSALTDRTYSHLEQNDLFPLEQK